MAQDDVDLGVLWCGVWSGVGVVILLKLKETRLTGIGAGPGGGGWGAPTSAGAASRAVQWSAADDSRFS